MPETPLEEDVKEASLADAQTTSAGSFRCEGSAALLLALQMSNLSLRLNPDTLRRKLISAAYVRNLILSITTQNL